MSLRFCGAGLRAIKGLLAQKRAVTPESEHMELARGQEVQTPLMSHPEAFSVNVKYQNRPLGLSDECWDLTLESTKMSNDVYHSLIACSSWRSFSADGPDSECDCELDGEADFEFSSKRLKTMREIPDQFLLPGHDDMEELERSNGGPECPDAVPDSTNPDVIEKLERDSGAIIDNSSFESLDSISDTSSKSSSKISADSSLASWLESSPPVAKHTNALRDFPEPCEYLTKSDIVKWQLEQDFAELIEEKLDKPTRCFRTDCFPDPSEYLSNIGIDRLRRQTDFVELSEGIGEDVHTYALTHPALPS